MKKLIFILLITIKLSGTEKQLNYAIDLMDHGLDDKATEAFITLFYQSDEDEIRSKCLFNMGKISLKKGNMQIAVKDWAKLVKSYPQSKEALEVKDQLSSIIQSSQADSLNEIKSAVAINYLNNASFYSKANERWTLDTSYLPSEDYAAYWCDRVIKEFPGTKAHELALKKKFFAYLGWKTQYSSYGIKRYGGKEKYMKLLEDIIKETESKFPSSGNLPAMCFQLGQHYWPDDDSSAKKWFDKTKSVSSKGDYYYELVEVRYRNWDSRGAPLAR
jgi:tetratricopeptide (TPR) repeat protein